MTDLNARNKIGLRIFVEIIIWIIIAFVASFRILSLLWNNHSALISDHYIELLASTFILFFPLVFYSIFFEFPIRYLCIIVRLRGLTANDIINAPKDTSIKKENTECKFC